MNCKMDKQMPILVDTVIGHNICGRKHVIVRPSDVTRWPCFLNETLLFSNECTYDDYFSYTLRHVKNAIYEHQLFVS